VRGPDPVRVPHHPATAVVKTRSGQRTFSRYMLLTKGFVDADGPERAQWQRESAEDVVRDAAWNQGHGPLPGGARILQWRHNAEQRSVVG
jgi:hypothetical protein